MYGVVQVEGSRRLEGVPALRTRRCFARNLGGACWTDDELLPLRHWANLRYSSPGVNSAVGGFHKLKVDYKTYSEIRSTAASCPQAACPTDAVQVGAVREIN